MAFVTISEYCPSCCEPTGEPCEDCTYDGDPQFEPGCYDYCRGEYFTQKVTKTSTTPGCENCVEVTEQYVEGCASCPCDCSNLGGGWSNTQPTCGPDQILETTSIDSEGLGLPPGFCDFSYCYRCVQTPYEESPIGTI